MIGFLFRDSGFNVIGVVCVKVYVFGVEDYGVIRDVEFFKDFFSIV